MDRLLLRCLGVWLWAAMRGRLEELSLVGKISLSLQLFPKNRFSLPHSVSEHPLFKTTPSS